MTYERFYDERDYEDGADPSDHYTYDFDDDLPDGYAPIPVVNNITDLFRVPYSGPLDAEHADDQEGGCETD